MELPVFFAILVLCVVFLLSGAILVAMCWRRIKNHLARRRADKNFRLARADEKVDNLVELSPLLANGLENLEWRAEIEAADATGPFVNILAILRLTSTISRDLSAVSVSRSAGKIYEVVVQAMFRVDTHFHELLEFTPTVPEDIRVLEARALTLTTTVWALHTAFIMHGLEPQMQKDVEAMVIEMYENVDAMRQMIPGYEGGAGRRRRRAGGGGAGAGGAAAAGAEGELVEEEEEDDDEEAEEETEEDEDENAQSQGTEETTAEPAPSASGHSVVQVVADVERAADDDDEEEVAAAAAAPAAAAVSTTSETEAAAEAAASSDAAAATSSPPTTNGLSARPASTSGEDLPPPAPPQPKPDSTVDES